MIADIKKAKRSELEEELDLYREAGTQGVADSDSLPNIATVKTEIERLQAEVGYPVKLTPEFIKENDTLAKFLIEQGAQEGDIVFAEDADLEEVAKIEAQIKEDADAKRTADEAAAVNQNAGAAAPTDPANGTVAITPDLVYQGKTVTNVVNAIVHGKAYKDVYVASGECFRMSPDEFTKDVTPRQ